MATFAPEQLLSQVPFSPAYLTRINLRMSLADVENFDQSLEAHLYLLASRWREGWRRAMSYWIGILLYILVALVAAFGALNLLVK